jgi:hypothetical protein
LGYFRPPGTFSFTTGNTQFFSLVGCFCSLFLAQYRAGEQDIIDRRYHSVYSGNPYFDKPWLAYPNRADRSFCAGINFAHPEAFGQDVGCGDRLVIIVGTAK